MEFEDRDDDADWPGDEFPADGDEQVQALRGAGQDADVQRDMDEQQDAGEVQATASDSESRRGGRGRRGGRRRRAERPAQEAAGDEAFEELSGPLVHVAFRGGRRESFQNTRRLELRVGDHVLAEAERGNDLGWVVAREGPALRRRKNQPLRSLLRHATGDEIGRLAVIEQEDREAHEICRSRAEHFNLDMKVIDAETQFDNNRVTFYFTAERRVDFRELVRDLARIFRTRIELRQVGARDAARRCDGIGPCGRRLCCTSFLRDFEPVTLKMAKQQNMALNPAKISGSCGRLMCCLTYEVQAYQEALRIAPSVGSAWQLSGSHWTVERLDIGNHRLVLKDDDGHTQAIDLCDFHAAALAEAVPESQTPAPGPSAEGSESEPQTRDDGSDLEQRGPFDEPQDPLADPDFRDDARG